MTDGQRLRKIQTDPRPTGELIQLALSQDEEENEYFDTLAVLHFRGTREVLDVARELCRSVIPKERHVGVDILGKLGDSVRILRDAHRALADDQTNGCLRDHNADIVCQLNEVIGDAQEFPEEVVPVLLQVLAEEEIDDILKSLAHALGQYTGYDQAVIEALVRLAGNDIEAIRHATAMSLGGVDNPLAIDTIIRLTLDEDDLVRDWATFSLAKLTDADTPEIRDALAARLDDEEDDVFGEAIYGLARCGDQRVIPALLSARRLQTAENYRYQALISAGKLIGDPRLLLALLWFKENGLTCGDNYYDLSDDADLIEAISHCLPELL